VAFGLEGKVDHHDGILLHNTDEQNDADQGNHAEIDAGDEQGQQRAHAGRGQRRDDGDGVDVALIEHAQHDVDDDEGRQDQERLALKRGLELRGAAGEGRHDRIGQADLLLGLLDGLRLARDGVGNDGRDARRSDEAKLLHADAHRRD